MHKKYFFFDVDGTLTVGTDDQTITKETFAALDALRENGHFVAIATGRAHIMAVDAMEKTGIDNAVCDGGYGFCLNGKVVDIKPLDRQKSLTICEELMTKQIPFAVVDGDSIDLHAPDDRFWQIAGHTVSTMKLHTYENFDPHKIKNFHKIFVALREEDEWQLESIHLMPFMRYHETAFVFEPDDKFSGIERMMTYLGAPMEDVVVFGDGKNDRDMFKKAPFCIAMGNAIDELKELADYVTANSDDDGIGKACHHFGWIK